ncbi:GH39 family glycosyl hydrolase [Bifidobacterium aerophilum]|nr:hypothetical protein [Bifidobacterium aerophilum]
MANTCHITVDTAHDLGPLDHSWNFIGYDECNYTYMPEGRQLLARFGTLSDAPYYVRTHFMFCTGSCNGTQKFGSTNVYRENAQGDPIYDFTYYDLILDAILTSGNKPFVELGFMPQALADPAYRNQPSLAGMDVYREVGWTYPPADYRKWHDFILAVARHLAGRYGASEIASWYFELWNEPDICYWSGTAEDYCTLYDFTEHALHEALPDARLSGPACTGIFAHNGARDLMRAFLRHCREGRNACTGATGACLDFITFHAKGSVFPADVTAAKAVPSVGSLVHQVRFGLELAREEGFDDLDVVVSEADPDGWSAGGIADNPNMRYRNTEYYASYVAAAYSRIRDLSREFGVHVRPLAWAFMFPQEECFAGTRTFATQGIAKPVFNLFAMLARMGSHGLPLRSDGAPDPACDRRLIPDFDEAAPSHYTGAGAQTAIDGFASRADDGSLRTLVYAHCDDIDEDGVTDVELRFDGLGKGRYRVVQYRIDDCHSNAHAVWLAQGSPKYPDDRKYATIKQADGLETIGEPLTLDVSESGRPATLWFVMPAHAVSLVRVERL